MSISAEQPSEHAEKKAKVLAPEEFLPILNEYIKKEGTWNQFTLENYKTS